jgi:hypothetical protein
VLLVPNTFRLFQTSERVAFEMHIYLYVLLHQILQDLFIILPCADM